VVTKLDVENMSFVTFCQQRMLRWKKMACWLANTTNEIPTYDNQVETIFKLLVKATTCGMFIFTWMTY
jgi:hypothetical protein